MLLCNETVTLVQYDERSETYRCIPLVGVSWYAKIGIVQTANGLSTANVLKSRIPAEIVPEGVAPRQGNYLVRGVLASMARQAELKGREHFKITAVSDNRRGRWQHWAVSGA